MNEALKMLERGDATAEDIDLAMKLGAGKPPLLFCGQLRLMFNELINFLNRINGSIFQIHLSPSIGYPMGPFQLQDMVGIDVYKFIVDAWKSKGADFVEESPLIDRMVKEGNLGRKTGKGFYDYTKK